LLVQTIQKIWEGEEIINFNESLHVILDFVDSLECGCNGFAAQFTTFIELYLSFRA
jgi:hypothetical protein